MFEGRFLQYPGDHGFHIRLTTQAHALTELGDGPILACSIFPLTGTLRLLALGKAQGRILTQIQKTGKYVIQVGAHGTLRIQRTEPLHDLEVKVQAPGEVSVINRRRESAIHQVEPPGIASADTNDLFRAEAGPSAPLRIVPVGTSNRIRFSKVRHGVFWVPALQMLG